jgi:hypothetical protein
MITRRGIITGLISLAAAPAVVRASSLMRCSPTEPELLGLSEFASSSTWPLSTPEQILDDIRRTLVEATGLPARLLFGEGLPPMTSDEIEHWQRVARYSQ